MAIDKGAVTRAVLTELAKQGLSRFVPVGVSARHVHLSEEDIEKLFGKNYKLTPIKALSQPDQYAAREQVTVVGPKGRLEHVRVLGPARPKTQIEVSVSDTFVLGAKNCPVRLSGDLAGTPGVKLLGPEGQVDLKEGLMVAARHLHLNDDQARALGIHDKQVVSVRVGGARPCLLENVIARTGSGHEMELHVDTDEANACSLKNGDLIEVVCGGSAPVDPQACPARNVLGSREISKTAPAWTFMGVSDMNPRPKEAETYGTPALRGQIGGPDYAGNPTVALSAPATFARGPMRQGVRGGDALNSMPHYGGNPVQAVPTGHTAYQGNPGYDPDGAPLSSDVLYNGNPSVAGGAFARQDYVSYGGNVPFEVKDTFAPNGGFYIGNPTVEMGQITSRPCAMREAKAAEPQEALDLVTESDVNEAFKLGRTAVYCLPRALVTPAAVDRAEASGIEIIRVKE